MQDNVVLRWKIVNKKMNRMPLSADGFAERLKTRTNATPLSSRRGLSPTLADVATKAGVSVSTAGRVLRNDGWPVDEELKERVRAAAAELGYVPNITARALRGGAPALVGLVIGNMLDPYYGEIGEAVTRHSEETGRMLVMVCNMQRDPLLEIEYCRRLWEHRVAGLILTGGGFDQFTHHDQLAALLEKMERSGTVITTLSPRDLDAPAFHVDNREAGRMAAAELVRHGHRDIGILVGPIHNRVLRQRVDAIAATLDAVGARHRLAEVGFGTPGIDLGITDLLTREPGITGIIAASGLTSLNAIDAIAATGRRVPEDVSVIGISGEAVGQWTTDRLSRIDLELEACGWAALDYIAARVSGLDASSRSEKAPRLVRGSSVARRD